MANRWQVIDRGQAELLEHLCALRGLDPLGLEPNFEEQLHDPLLLPGIGAARAIIKEAVTKSYPTIIFGDYDADGTPAAALLSVAFNRLGVPNQVILPTRDDGYGLKIATLDRLPGDTKLLITVDTGITSVEEIAEAKKRGLQVIVIDHHLPKSPKEGGLPPADAVIDPFVPENTYPFTGLCGCALAYKFVEALSLDFPQLLNEAFRKWQLDLVAISTVADMMPIIGENRVLVHYGLQVLRKTRRPGLKALLEAAGLSTDKITGSSLGFTIGPRLNASGRLHDNRPAFDLLTTTSSAEAGKLAEVIENNNRFRQQAVEKILAEAEQEVLKQNELADHCFIIAKEGWPAGVVGLVAGKIANRYHRPAIVLTGGSGTLTGSARSIGDFSIIQSLDSQKALLLRYGGHEQAAGLTLDRKNLGRFVDGIKAHARTKISPDELIPSFQADALLSSEELTLPTAETIERLAPFGQANQSPLFFIPDISLRAPKLLGASGNHVKWRGQKDGAEFDVIGFGMGNRDHTLERADVMTHLEKNVWRDRATLQLRLVDFRVPTGEIELINGQTKKPIRLS